MGLNDIRGHMNDFADWCMDTGLPATAVIIGILLISPILIPLLIGYTIYRFCYHLFGKE